MSTRWRFEVGGIYQHCRSHRRVLILAEGDRGTSHYPPSYRHVSAYPLSDIDQDALDVYLDWNYPPECENTWSLVGRVAVNPRTSDAP